MIDLPGMVNRVFGFMNRLAQAPGADDGPDREGQPEETRIQSSAQNATPSKNRLYESSMPPRRSPFSRRAILSRLFHRLLDQRAEFEELNIFRIDGQATSQRLFRLHKSFSTHVHEDRDVSIADLLFNGGRGIPGAAKSQAHAVAIIQWVIPEAVTVRTVPSGAIHEPPRMTRFSPTVSRST